jgi:hypothetical protein
MHGKANDDYDWSVATIIVTARHRQRRAYPLSRDDVQSTFETQTVVKNYK